jgi:hypothetical protein
VTGEGFDLEAWLGRLAADDAARARAESGWLRRQAEEEGTFDGVLADLAERGRPLVVAVRNGRSHRATIAALGADFVLLRTGAHHELLVRRAAITSVRTRPGDAVTIGDRLVRTERTLAEAAAALVDDRPRVLVVGADVAATVAGELRAVGADVLTVRLDGAATAYVPLSSVDELSLTESG